MKSKHDRTTTRTQTSKQDAEHSENSPLPPGPPFPGETGFSDKSSERGSASAPGEGPSPTPPEIHNS